MLLLIDNYDSFTYNLFAYFQRLQIETRVVRHDQITLAQIDALAPKYIVISPGPCTPNESGISQDVIRTFSGKKPILGVCLGHQCIAQVFGGQVTRAAKVMHGKTSMISHDGTGLLRGISNPFVATRYHSLMVEPSTLPSELKATAFAEDKTIMAIRHQEHPTHGIQFHPESVLSTEGLAILENFIRAHSL